MQISKLDGMEARYMALEDQLSDPSVIADQNRWRELSKEHAELGEIVFKYREYKEALKGIQDALELLDDKSQADLHELAKEELKEVNIEDEVTDVICEQCGRNMVVKYGPHGKFLACPGFPDCRNTKPYLEKTGIPCPKCGKEIVIRKTKKGRRYYGCEAAPECDFMSWQKPSKEKCPQCGSILLEKGNKLVCSREGCGYVMVKENKE